MSVNQKKVLIITNKVLNYRNDLYELLGEKVDLTVVHAGDFKDNRSYKLIKLEKLNFKTFYYYKGLKSFLKKNAFDTIISIYDLYFLNNYNLAASKFKNKLLFWGIGISSSNGLKEKKLTDIFRLKLASKSKGVILYSETVKNIYLANGFKKEIFVATNSTLVSSQASEKLEPSNTINFLSIGALNKRKGIDVFLKALAKAKHESKINNLRAFIVGSGAEKENLEALVKQLDIVENVVFFGRISNPEKLTELYQKSIFSFSINQAGLSVLQSLGNGVPFVASQNAITGGELFNIKNEETGFLIPSGDEQDQIQYLTKLIKRTTEDKEHFIKMRKVCKTYYLNEASLDHMIVVFLKAINSI